MSGEARNNFPIRAWLWKCAGRHLLAWTFHNWYGIRRAILRAFGAELTGTSLVRPTAVVTHPWNLVMGKGSAIGDFAYVDSTERVVIGDFCTVSQHARVLTTMERPKGASPLRGPITIETDGWVATETMVFPGVTVGAGAILGARGTARESLAPWTIFGGDPVRTIGPRTRPTE
ncbi:MAG: putative colanic acid biosynthesis acetyltransferase [Planctomycetes bacterium]|nr:putative colanic acid biosynthesis acetyltransferase [Planctomycetota bacterium]